MVIVKLIYQRECQGILLCLPHCNPSVWDCHLLDHQNSSSQSRNLWVHDNEHKRLQ